MNCCRWLLSPCISLCPCLEKNEYLLTTRDRRATLSVSTHDDDWDVEIGYEDQIKRSNNQVLNANTTMASELQLQMQKMSGNSQRTMQNVMVTEDDESTHAVPSSSNSAAWNGYTTTVQDIDQEKSTKSGQGTDQRISNKGNLIQSNSLNNLNGRAPYRDEPYSDAQHSVLEKNTSQKHKNSESITPQTMSVNIDDDDDEEVEISLL